MYRSTFTDEQLQELRNNPNVLEATSKRIVYTVEFKKKFIDEYRQGKGPREIFIEAGFDVDALGHKRIERASDRWRQAYNSGRLGEKTERVEVHRRRARKHETMRETIERQSDEITKLENELSELRAELLALKA